MHATIIFFLSLTHLNLMQLVFHVISLRNKNKIKTKLSANCQCDKWYTKRQMCEQCDRVSRY